MTNFAIWTLTGGNTGPSGTGKRVRISGYELWKIDNDGLLRRQSQHLTKKTFMLLENGLQSKPLPMTTAEGNKPNCPTTAADEEDLIRRRLDDVLKLIGCVEPDIHSEVERLLRSDLSDRQLRGSELSVIARSLLDSTGKSTTDEN